MRIGFGFDVHQLVENRKLILGGIEIPSTFGSLGHSDADVLLHAICDALLGAAALGDIGKHFPDTDIKYKDISSLILLSEVNTLLIEKNYKVNNIDSTIVLEKPRISPFIPGMIENISNKLKIGTDRISIKATTSEKMGYIGKGEGICAYAVATIVEKE